MNVELPSSGCNVINSSTTFYNYSSDSRTRETYVIYDGVAHLQASQTNQYGYTYSGTCLHTGDLVYHPELQVQFPIYSLFIVVLLTVLVYRVMIKRLLP